jgi:radical SAM protein with 4Fe4S-binding SPASM domain
MGAESICINTRNPYVDIYQEICSSPDQLIQDTLAAYLLLIAQFNGKIKMDIKTPLCLFPTEFVKDALANKRLVTTCQAFSRSSINFDSNGNVLMCNALASSIIAEKGIDYKDGASLMTYLNSNELYEEYRQLVHYPSDECSDCQWENDCRGGCLLNWLASQPSACRMAQ